MSGKIVKDLVCRGFNFAKRVMVQRAIGAVAKQEHAVVSLVGCTARTVKPNASKSVSKATSSVVKGIESAIADAAKQKHAVVQVGLGNGIKAGQVKPDKVSIWAQWFSDEVQHAKNTGTPIRSFSEIWKDSVSLDGRLGKLFKKLGLQKDDPLREYLSKEISKASARGEKPFRLVAKDATAEEMRAFFTSSGPSVMQNSPIAILA